MSERWPGGIISATAPTVSPASAPGIWTMDQANYYIANGTWPYPGYGLGLWSWGQNNVGQLGLGNTTYYSSPKQIGAITTWTTIAQGYQHKLAIKTDGTLWSWGYNGDGQLGLNSATVSYSSPKQVGALTNWLKVAANFYASFAIKTDGTLWSWGQSQSGQLGLGNVTSYSSPKQIGALTTWSFVSAGALCCYAIKTDGTLWSWGRNDTGQLGLGNSGAGTYKSSPNQVGALTTWLNISAGSYFAIAVKTDGTLWTWGYNAQGQLALGNVTYYSSPKQVGLLTTWSKSSSLTQSVIAIKTDGTMWGWGVNSSGQLGLGDTTVRSSPAQIGSLTTWSLIGAIRTSCLAIKTDGTLWSWGVNAQGQLGLGNTTNRSSPTQIGLLTSWTKIASGPAYTGFAISS